MAIKINGEVATDVQIVAELNKLKSQIQDQRKAIASLRGDLKHALRQATTGRSSLQFDGSEDFGEFFNNFLRNNDK